MVLSTFLCEFLIGQFFGKKAGFSALFLLGLTSNAIPLLEIKAGGNGFGETAANDIAVVAVI